MSSGVPHRVWGGGGEKVDTRDGRLEMRASTEMRVELKWPPQPCVPEAPLSKSGSYTLARSAPDKGTANGGSRGSFGGIQHAQDREQHRFHMARRLSYPCTVVRIAQNAEHMPKSSCARPVIVEPLAAERRVTCMRSGQRVVGQSAAANGADLVFCRYGFTFVECVAQLLARNEERRASVDDSLQLALP